MKNIIDFFRKAVDDGNGFISTMRIVTLFGVFTIVPTFCFIAIYAAINSEPFKNPIPFTELCGLLGVVLTAKVGQSFSEK